MNDIIENILNKIKRTFKSKAIILHGSRARGYFHDKSDWDFYVIEPSVSSELKEYLGQNIDISIVENLEKLDMKEFFGYNLFGAQILFDPSGIGEYLIAKMNTLYTLGRNLSKDEILSRKNYFKRGIIKLESLLSHPIEFELKFCDMYPRIYRYFFEIVRNEWTENPILSNIKLKENNPEFLNLLTKIISARSSSEKLEFFKVFYNTYL